MYLLVLQSIFGQSTEKQILTFGNLIIDDSHLPQMQEVIKRESKVPKKDLTIVYLGGFTDMKGSLGMEAYSTLAEMASEVLLVPGAHEWEKLGTKGIRDLEVKIKERFDRDVIVPYNACGEIETKSISDEIEILAIDSEWYLQDWNGESDLNKDCTIKDRDQFEFVLRDEIFSAKEKVIILFMYHPPFRFDRKSGHHTALDHIFPLRVLDKNLYVPLPLLGSFMIQTQAYLRTSDYLTHPLYRGLSKKVENLAKDHQKMIVISADADQTYVVRRHDCDFFNVNTTESNHRQVLENDGQSTMLEAGLSIIIREGFYSYSSFNFWNNVEEGNFSGERKLPQNISDEISPDSIAPSPMDGIVTAPIFEPENLPELDGDYFTGTLHTDLYSLPISASILNLREEGNLTPTKIGGGNQTVSVRLEDPDEREFVVRTVRKNPTKLLPSIFQNTIAKDLVEYYFTAANPFSFLVLKELEAESGLYHTNPELRFLPYQKRLSPYNDEIGDQLVLFSDQADGDRSDSKSLKFSPKIISTANMIEKVRENDIRISAETFLKNRLLDLTVGDWDRHEGQWRWAEQANDTCEVKTYYPVARDRDQALSNFDGLFLSILRLYIPSIKPMRPFDAVITKGDIAWHSISANFLDQFILTKIDRAQWLSVAEEYQRSIDQEDIRKAVDQIPNEVSDTFKTQLAEKLTARWSALRETAALFYDHINEHLYLFASTSGDSIIAKPDGKKHTQIVIKSKDDKDRWFNTLERTIDHSITKSIHIFGLEGKDVFIADVPAGGPSLTLVGGFGDDQYHQLTKKSKLVKVLEVVDDDEDMVGKRFKHLLTMNRDLESFSKKDLLPTYFNIAPDLRHDRDDYLFLGITGHWFKTSFKKKTHQSLGVTFATRRRSAALYYELQIDNSLRNSSFFIKAKMDGPKYNANFYGLGNNTQIDLEVDRSFYFVRQRIASVKLGQRWTIGKMGAFSAAVRTERIQVDTTVSERFINDDLPNRTALGPNLFGGIDLNLDFRNLNHAFRPTDGVYLGADIISNFGIDNSRTHVLISTYYGLYKSLGHNSRFVYSTKVEYNTIFGKYFFYHAPTIGGRESLRGFRLDRFRGKSALFHNNNIHIKLTDRVAKGFPVAMGVSGSFDYGRVWIPDESSKKWHSTWGVGIWASPLKLIILSASVHLSRETNEFRASLGWQF